MHLFSRTALAISSMVPLSSSLSSLGNVIAGFGSSLSYTANCAATKLTRSRDSRSNVDLEPSLDTPMAAESASATERTASKAVPFQCDSRFNACVGVLSVSESPVIALARTRAPDVFQAYLLWPCSCLRLRGRFFPLVTLTISYYVRHGLHSKSSNRPIRIDQVPRGLAGMPSHPSMVHAQR